MGKRFTDTEKFTDPWYRRLPSKYKLLWEYLTCSCDLAGIITLDMEYVEMLLNEKFTSEEISFHFEGRLISTGRLGQYFIPKFITFQNGRLSDRSPIHRKIISLLGDADIDHETLKPKNSVALDTLSIGYQKGTEYPVSNSNSNSNSKGKSRGISKQAKKIKEPSELSPLESAAFDSDINSWLRTGSPKLQQKLVDTYEPSYLNEVIEKAYYWQLENKKRDAGTFLSSWIDRDTNKKFKDAISPAERAFIQELQDNERKFNEAN